ncbi:unnamed protein product [Pylaiella littoralis]
MALRHRNLRVKANPSCFDLSTVLEAVRTDLNLIYLGIWYHDGSVYVYAQSAERMSDIMLTKALKDHMVMTNIAPLAARGVAIEACSCKQEHCRQRQHYRCSRAPSGQGVFSTHHQRVHRGFAETPSWTPCLVQIWVKAVLVRAKRELPGTQRVQEGQAVLWPQWMDNRSKGRGI